MLDTWVGRPADDLVDAWGAPTRHYEKSDNSKILQYESRKDIILPGYVPYEFYDYRYGIYSHDYIVTKECITIFHLDQRGIITGWQWKGNNCISTDPETGRR